MAGLPQGSVLRRGEVYHLRYKYRLRDHTESLHTSLLDEAEKRARDRMEEIRVQIRRGEYDRIEDEKRDEEARRKKEIPLDEAWDRYRATRKSKTIRDGTREQYRLQFGVFREWLRSEHPTATTLAEVTDGIAQQFIDHVQEGRKASVGTKNKYLDLLGMLWRELQPRSKDARNPWERIERDVDRQHGRRTFSKRDVQQIFLKACGWLRTLFLLGFYTGMRLGDCCRLRWSQVDFSRGTMDVMPNKTRDSSGLNVELPMFDELKQHLEELWEKSGRPREGYVMPDIAGRYEKTSTRCGLSVDIQEFLEGCGIPVHAEGTGTKNVRAVVNYGFHSCRHTFVTHCRRRGVQAFIVRAIVGNSYDRYEHASQEDLMELVDVLDDMSGTSGVGKPPDKLGKIDVASLGTAELEEMVARLTEVLHERRLAEKRTESRQSPVSVLDT